MEISIEHHRIKRKLIGTGFNICGSRDDLRRIATEILEKTDENFTFGWVQVRDAVEDIHDAGASTEAKAWMDSV